MTLIHSARVVSSGTVIENAWVSWEDNKILARGVGKPPPISNIDTTIDAHGRWLTPGFIDMHGHGGGGESFNNGDFAIETALALHRRHGTTRSVLSLSTASMENLETQLQSIHCYAKKDHLVLGAHVEGPFLSMGHRGSHDPNLLTVPDKPSIDRLIAAGSGIISQITLAPELPGAQRAIERFLDEDIVVAVGHTSADMDTTLAAFQAGATVLTHSFNGMSGIHHRDPGPVMAAIRSSGVFLELINDHVHVHPDVAGLLFANAPERVVMISDAMAAAGSVDGEYMSGTMRVVVRGGVAQLADGSSISGSTLTLDVALRNAVSVGVPIEHAVRALTETPAKALRLGHQYGKLDVGYAADAVLLDDDLMVTNVWAAGAPIPLH